MSSPLAGMEVALTGRLVSMTRGDAIERIQGAGGRFARVPGESTHILVAGQALGPLRQDGSPAANLALFRELRSRGASIRLVDESEFLRLLGAAEELEDLDRQYTTTQVARIIDTPVSEIRSWLRHGLLQPSRMTGRLAWFRFEDIICARSLSRLASAGIPPARIRQSLDELARWLPDAGRMLARLQAYESGLAVQLPDGNWAEPSGQRLMDLTGAPGRAAQDRAAPKVADFPGGQGILPDTRSLFAAGAEAEERGELREAERAYTLALEGSPDPEVLFNLGNVLYALGREADAAARYLQAVEADREFVEAWNNLGNAMASLGKNDDAIRSYRLALAVQPDYPDAHCNLASLLERRGRFVEARVHRTECEKAYPRKRVLTLLKVTSADDGEE